MEAVGTEVVAVIFPVVAIVCAAVYYYWDAIKLNFNILAGRNVAAPEVPVNEHPLYGQGECSICLDQPKKFEVSATCGHSFCGACLITIYERNVMQQMICPLCRKKITTIFKTFHGEEEPAAQRERIVNKVREYNDRFDDNRPWSRRIQEFPFVFRNIWRYLSHPRFWVLFFRSIYFLRFFMLGILYILLPLDILPESALGVIGYLDDLIIFGVLMTFAMTIFAVIYMRRA